MSVLSSIWGDVAGTAKAAVSDVGTAVEQSVKQGLNNVRTAASGAIEKTGAAAATATAPGNSFQQALTAASSDPFVWAMLALLIIIGIIFIVRKK